MRGSEGSGRGGKDKREVVPTIDWSCSNFNNNRFKATGRAHFPVQPQKMQRIKWHSNYFVAIILQFTYTSRYHIALIIVPNNNLLLKIISKI